MSVESVILEVVEKEQNIALKSLKYMKLMVFANNSLIFSLLCFYI